MGNILKKAEANLSYSVSYPENFNKEGNRN